MGSETPQHADADHGSERQQAQQDISQAGAGATSERVSPIADGGLTMAQQWVLAIQRTAGNRAAQRLLVDGSAAPQIQRWPPPGGGRTPAAGGTTPAAGGTVQAPAPGGGPAADVFGVIWAMPSSNSRTALLAELRQYASAQAERTHQPVILTATVYFIVTDKLYVFDNSGAQQAAYDLRPNARTFGPGYYLALRGRPYWAAYGYREHEQGFYEYAMLERGAEIQMANWVAEGVVAQLQIYLDQARSGAVLMAISEGGQGGGEGGTSQEESQGGGTPAWATRQVADLQQALGGAGGQGRRGTGTGGGETTGGTAGGGGGGETTSAAPAAAPPSAGTTTPPAGGPRYSPTPDRVVLWCDARGPHLNVWAENAHRTLDLFEGEPTDELLHRVQVAAQALRQARDPSQSIGLAGGAAQTGFQQPAGPLEAPATAEAQPGAGAEGAPVPGGAPRANAPAYPSHIETSGVSTSVVGASNRFSMILDYSVDGPDVLSQVGARMQPINYYWELFNVTDLAEQQRLAATARRATGTGTAVGPGSGEGNQLARTFGGIAEDTSAELRDIADNPGIALAVAPATMAWLQVMAVSNTVRGIGALVSSYASIVTQPLNERNIGFDRVGVFVVRCTATPHPAESRHIPPEQRRQRASSIAAAVIAVVPIQQRAVEANRADLDAIAQQRRELADMPPGPERTARERDVEAMVAATEAGPAASVDSTIHSLERALASLTELETADRNDTPRESRSPEARILDVQLQLSNTARRDYRRDVERQLAEARALRGRVGHFGSRFHGTTYRPHVTLASEETGQIFPMVMMLGQAADSREGGRHYILADVTSASTQQTYEGRSGAAGEASHNEAIFRAFIDFRENAEYGRGTIAVRMPEALERDLGFQIRQVPATMRAAPGRRGRAMQRLNDLATAASIAGLVVTGPAGMAIGAIGGVAGAVVAVESMRRRAQGDRLRWMSHQTFNDVMAIAGGFVGLAGPAVGALGRAPRIARYPAWVTRVNRAERGLQIFGMVQLTQSVIEVPWSLVEQFEAIDNDTSLTPGQKAARRAEALLGALRSGVITIMTARQMLDQPPTPSRPAGEGAAQQPAEGAGQPRSQTPETAAPRPVTPERTGPAPEGTAPTDTVGPVAMEPPAGTPQPEQAQTGGARETPPTGARPAGAPETATGPVGTPEGGGTQPETPREQGGPPTGARGRGPSGAAPEPDPTFHAPTRVEAVSAETWIRNTVRTLHAGGEHWTIPSVGRVRVIDESLATGLWERATRSPMPGPDQVIGFRDPDSNQLYVSRDRLTPALREQFASQLQSRVSRLMRNTLGESLTNGFMQRFQSEALFDSQTPPSQENPSGQALAARFEALVGREQLAAAMFEGDIGPLRTALNGRFGPARAGAIEAALRAGRDNVALRLLDEPQSGFRDMFGDALAAGVADSLAASMGAEVRGNAERRALADRLAAIVGRDVLHQAFLTGDPTVVRQALGNALGSRDARAVVAALSEGQLQTARQILDNARPRAPGVPRATPVDAPVAGTEARPESRPTPEAGQAETPAAGTRQPTPTAEAPRTPVGQHMRQFIDGVGANPTGDHAANARAALLEVGSFRRVRQMVEAGDFGPPGPGRDAAMAQIQHARQQIVDEVIAQVFAELQQRYPGLELAKQDLGTPGFGSDRDVTLRGGGEHANASDQVRASIEAVRETYRRLTEMGFPPDRALDSNFYTELHEELFAPADTGEASRIHADQSVVSLAEMRMRMNAEQWQAYQRQQLEALGQVSEPAGGGGERGRHTGAEGALEADARQRLRQQFEQAERLATDLGAGQPPEARERLLQERRQALLEALGRTNPPATAQELRRLMAEIKLLEPDAYGTRAAVLGVPLYQQALARAESGAAAMETQTGRPARLRGPGQAEIAQRLGTLAQEASASLAMMFGHAHGPGRNTAGDARALAKYLDRVLHAFQEAGFQIQDAMIDRTGRIVVAKQESDSTAATLRELRVWAEDANLTGLTDQQLIDRFVERAQNLGQELVVRLRAEEQRMHAIEAPGSQQGVSGTGTPWVVRPPGTPPEEETR